MDVDHPRDTGATLRRASETRTLAAMLDALPSLVAYVDADGRSRYANAAALRWWGRSPREAAGMPIAQLLDAGWAEARPHVEAALAGVPQRFEGTVSLPGGRVTHAQTEYLPCTRHELPDGFYVLVTDVSRRFQAEAGHHAALAQGALLEERNRTAADLHDTVLQRLFAAGLHLDRLRDDPAHSPGHSPSHVPGHVPRHTPEAVEAAIDTIQQAIEELRTSVRGLALGKGLSFPVTALEQVVTASRPELGVVPDLLLRGDLGQLPEAVVRAVLAVLVELLAGVGRKDGVRSVRVTVTASPGSVGLRVADDGTGPALHEREADLAGLRIRVHSLGGRLTDRRRPVGGSVVTLRLPLPLGPPDVTQPASVMPVREAG